MPDQLDPNAVINQSSGLFARNPTHVQLAENAEDQSDIVKAINYSGVKRMTVRYDYSEMDKGTPLPLMGILKIREMDREAAMNFCRNLMRSRPNIFKVHIRLGDHQNIRRIDNQDTRLLAGQKPRFHTEIGEKMGAVLSDKRYLVTELKYVVHNAEPGQFNSTAEVYGTTEEEYMDDEKFSPVIEIEFIKTT